MNQIVPIGQTQAPAKALQRLQAKESMAKNFSEGVADSFPVLSVRGKIFRFKYQGEETAHIDANRMPIPYIDLVLVNGSASISKVYYAKGFEEGDMNPPDCWSINGITPDASVTNKQSPTCKSCPQNAFGSRITGGAKSKGKACADSRRVVVVSPSPLGVNDTAPIMLRIPQTSLKNLRDYVLYLEKHGFMPNACVTRFSFDINQAYPMLQFSFIAPLTDAQYDHVLALENDDRTTRILEAPIDGPASEEMDGQDMTTLHAPAPAAQQTGYVAVQPNPELPGATTVSPSEPEPAPDLPPLVPTPPVSVPVAPPQAPQPVPPPPPQAAWKPPTNGATQAPNAAWKPADTTPPAGTPQFLMKDASVQAAAAVPEPITIDAVANEAPEAPPQPKPRTRPTAPEGVAVQPVVTKAPAALEALLGGLISKTQQ